MSGKKTGVSPTRELEKVEDLLCCINDWSYQVSAEKSPASQSTKKKARIIRDNLKRLGQELSKM